MFGIRKTIEHIFKSLVLDQNPKSNNNTRQVLAYFWFPNTERQLSLRLNHFVLNTFRVGSHCPQDVLSMAKPLSRGQVLLKNCDLSLETDQVRF